MKKNFIIYLDGEEFPEENAKNLEKAMYGFVDSDVRLAIELTFVDGEEIQRAL